MAFLHFLEELRTPLGDVFFSLITHLGEESVFIVIGLLFFWCVDKLEGYYLLSVGLLGTIFNQFLKLFFRIPRPWVRDESFTIVESARAEATGYSFPSGHTQTSVGVYGAIARWHSHKLVRALGIAVCVLVPLSRMYLGVHTPADVGVSVALALILIFAIYPIVRRAVENPRSMRIFLLFAISAALGYLTFVHLYPFPADTDADNLAHGIKNAFTLLGCVTAVALTFEVDTRYLHFDTKAVWWAQLLKLVLGLIPLLGIKAGLKAPLYALFGGSYAADFFRYFLMVAFAGCLWPMTFRFFSKLGKKRA